MTTAPLTPERVCLLCGGPLPYGRPALIGFYHAHHDLAAERAGAGRLREEAQALIDHLDEKHHKDGERAYGCIVYDHFDTLRAALDAGPGQPTKHLSVCPECGGMNPTCPHHAGPGQDDCPCHQLDLPQGAHCILCEPGQPR